MWNWAFRQIRVRLRRICPGLDFLKVCFNQITCREPPVESLGVERQGQTIGIDQGNLSRRSNWTESGFLAPKKQERRRIIRAGRWGLTIDENANKYSWPRSSHLTRAKPKCKSSQFLRGVGSTLSPSCRLYEPEARRFLAVQIDLRRSGNGACLRVARLINIKINSGSLIHYLWGENTRK